VQRRILYTMHHELHLGPDSRTVKCARIVGDVMGKYHPHGDMAIYETLVRLAQSWVMCDPLVFGQGNFGSVDGDMHAQQRYTEAKLTAIAQTLMDELRQKTVPMRPTYDGEREEPVVLPAQFPHLLVNGTAGIAVGMATNIPPHNLGETVRAAIHLIENPDASTAQLLDRLKGPDFPLGGEIVTDRRELRKIYEDGQGSIKVQGEWKVEERGRKTQLIITSIPYGVNKGTLEQQIGTLIAERKIPQLTDLTNETNEKEGLRIALDMKPDADPNVVMAYLYKNTELQSNFAVNMTCLVPDEDGNLQPQRVGLKEVLRHFLDFRFETVKRRFEFELEQLRKRIHILEGFKIIFNALDRAIKIIRESDGKADAADKLMRVFKLDEIQADAILEAQLYRIAQMEIKKILDELREKKRLAEEIEAILRSKAKLWRTIKDELNQVGEIHGSKRRTRIGSSEDVLEFDPEAYIVKENTNVVVTRDGWIKRVGRLASLETTRIREGDSVLAVVPGSTLDHVVFFADDGTACTMRITEVPATTGYGEPLAKFFKLDDQVRVVAAATTDERFVPATIKGKKEDPPGPYLLVVTQEGLTLRTPYAPFRAASTKVGRRYVKLNEGDKVVMAEVLTGKEENLFLASEEGRCLLFPIGEINILSGVGKGVIGIKLQDGDTCLGGTLLSDRVDRMQVETSNGTIQDFRGEKYEVTSRAGKGFEAIKRGGFTRVVPPPIQLVDWEEIEGEKVGRNGQGMLFR